MKKTEVFKPSPRDNAGGFFGFVESVLAAGWGVDVNQGKGAGLIAGCVCLKFLTFSTELMQE